MTKAELVSKLKKLSENSFDPENEHYDADMLLLAYIDDKEVTEAFKNITRWYA